MNMLQQRIESGYVVKTKSGKNGQTRHSDDPVNGKIPVYIFDGSKLLCDPEKLKVVGNYD